jgi:hypothetical protein
MGAIVTWADGYGRWHASVPLSDSQNADARRARVAILAELEQRSGRHWDPGAVHITRYAVDYTANTAKYRET